MSSHLPRWIVPALWILAALDIVNGIEMFFFPSAWFFRLVDLGDHGLSNFRYFEPDLCS